MSSEAQHDETNRIIKPVAAGLTFISSHAADANIFAADLTPTREVGEYRVLCSFGQVGRLKVYTEDGAGTNFLSSVLSSVGTLAANESYSFPLYVRNTLSYNFQFTAAGTVNILQIDEVG